MIGMATQATITLPFLPPVALSPNARVHWSVKAKATRMMKEATYVLAKSQQLPAFTKARLHITFVIKAHRRRDADNWLAMMKGAIDGLVEAKVLPDDSAEFVSYATPTFVVDKVRSPRTIIKIEETRA